MKNTLFVFLFLSFCTFQSCNNKKQKNDTPVVSDSSIVQEHAESSTIDSTNHQLLSDIVLDFVKAYNERDNQKINRYIKPDLGIIIIHRPGAMDWFEKVDKIDFERPVPSYYPYERADNKYEVSYDIAPKFDCVSEKWTKEGFFIDLITQTNKLRPIANSLKEYNDVELDPNYKEQIEAAEKDSYRIVLTSKSPLIFHLKQFDDGWFVTILDRSYADCGA